MTKKTLKARDVERLENTSFASILPGNVADLGVVEAGETCSCACETCTCCLPNIDQSDFCCDVTIIETLDGRCAVGTSRLLSVTARYVDIRAGGL